MSNLQIVRGFQFRPDLANKRTQWLDAVGKELATRGIKVKVGVGTNAVEVQNEAELTAAYKKLEAGARVRGSKEAGYLADLMQSLDDLVNPSSQVAAGDSFDLSMDNGSKVSSALGLEDGKRSNYATGATEFGKARTENRLPLILDGVTLNAIGAVGPTPPPSGEIIADLSKIPHMSQQALAGVRAAYGRAGQEVEDTGVVTGISTAQISQMMKDRNVLNDFMRPRGAVGLTLGNVPLDQMAWDRESNDLRRANPYLSFTLDDRSYEINPDSGRPRVAIGRDFFFDTFFAQKDLATGNLTKGIQDAGLMYRARIRYGSDQNEFDGTRVLIQTKKDTRVVNGVKIAEKVDSRTDSATREILDSLINTTQTGKLGAGWTWGGNSQIAPAAVAVYRASVQGGLTRDVRDPSNALHNGVLALEPAAVARQIRGRFHLNETRTDALRRAFQEAGVPKLEELVTLIDSAADWQPGNNQPTKAELAAQGRALIDRSAVVEAAAEELKKLDPALAQPGADLKAAVEAVWPDKDITLDPQRQLMAQKQRVVADTLARLYNRFADNVNGLQRQIAGVDDAARAAGSANDVQDFLRDKAGIAKFMAYAEGNSTTGVKKGDPATYAAYAKKVVDMPEGNRNEREAKRNLLQEIGVGLEQIRNLATTPAAFESKIRVNPELALSQTFGGFLKEYRSQLTGADKDTFVGELADFLERENNGTLKNAQDKNKVLADIEKNLVASTAEIDARMIGASGGWGQALWFNNYRQAMLDIDAQGWNFLIASADYTEFYDAKTGLDLPFQQRAARTALDGSKMKGAMLSNDIQIELESEEAYTGAIANAQYAINAAAAGLLMDYAQSKGQTGVGGADLTASEKWFSGQNLTDATFINELTAFAKGKGSSIAVGDVLDDLADQQKSIGVFVGFALSKNPALNANDRAGIKAWYQGELSRLRNVSNQPGQPPKPTLDDFMTEIAVYAANQKMEIPLAPEIIERLDFAPFGQGNVGRDYATHKALTDRLGTATEVWNMVQQAQRDLSKARGREIARVLDNNGVSGTRWEPPTKPKGGYAVDLALDNVAQPPAPPSFGQRLRTGPALSKDADFGFDDGPISNRALEME